MSREYSVYPTFSISIVIVRPIVVLELGHIIYYIYIYKNLLVYIDV